MHEGVVHRDRTITIARGCRGEQGCYGCPDTDPHVLDEVMRKITRCLEGKIEPAVARERDQQLRNAVKATEGEMAKLTTERSAIERAMFDPATAEPHHAKLSMTDLMKLRASVADRLETAEEQWVKASEGLEVAA